jgi:hypothetical protein
VVRPVVVMCVMMMINKTDCGPPIITPVNTHGLRTNSTEDLSKHEFSITYGQF